MPYNAVEIGRSKVKRGKEPGSDFITTETLHLLPLAWVSAFQVWFGQIIVCGTLPCQWLDSRAPLLPKISTPKCFSQFRQVVLDCICFEWFTASLHVLCEPSFAAVSYSLPQFADSIGSQSVDIPFVTRCIIRSYLVWPIGGLCIAQLDLHKAFDSLFQSAVIKMLQSLHLRQESLHMFVQSITSQTISPTFSGTEGKKIEVFCGIIKQGRIDSMRRSIS